jgi:triosephosphate isomerase
MMSARRPILAANWKMHKSHLEAIQTVQKLSSTATTPNAWRS